MTSSRADRSFWVFAGLLAVSGVIAAAPWFRAYSSRGAEVAIVVAAVASLGTAVIGSRILRWKLHWSLALSAACLLLVLLAESGWDPSTLINALVHAPGRLVTETLPLAGAPAAAPVVVVSWFAGAATGEAAARTRRRSQASGLALATPVVWFVASLGVTARAPGSDWLEAPLLLVTLAGAAFARHEAAGPDHQLSPDSEGIPSTSHRIARWIVPSAVLASVLAAVIPALPGVGAAPAAVSEVPPNKPELIVNPVAALGALRDGDTSARGTAVFRIETSGPSDGYLTVAVLDRYDGAEWTFQSTFNPTGGRVPLPAGYVRPAFGTSTLAASTTLLRRPAVPLLPVPGRALSVSGMTVAADTVHGMIAPDQGYKLPARYRTVSETPVSTLLSVPPADGIGASPPASGIEAAGAPTDLEVPPDGTAAIATAARFLGAISGVRPAPTVSFLQQSIAAIGRVDKRIIPGGSTGGAGRSEGTSLSEVINAVTVNRSATPEQFATFFALVARYLGVPANVVTGFRLQPDAPGVRLSAGSYTVSDKQAWTWVEIPVSGMGWVAADPTPSATTGLATPPPEQVQAPSSTVPPQRANAVPRSGTGGHAVARPVTLKARPEEGTPTWLLVVIASGAFLVLLGAAPGIAEYRRWRRRRRRMSSDPAVLASGAWLELLDGLTRAGMEVPDGSTSLEIAGEAARHFGDAVTPRVAAIGSVADRAVCSVIDPPDDQAALAAWNGQRDLQHDIFGVLDRRQRLRALLTTGRRTRAGRR